MARNQLFKDGSAALVRGNVFEAQSRQAIWGSIAEDCALNDATVVLGDPIIRADEGVVVLAATVNRNINGLVCPPEWTLAHGNETNHVALQLGAFVQLGVARMSQIVQREGQSTFILELQPGAVRPGTQYTVWFRPTPSSSKVDHKTFKV